MVQVKACINGSRQQRRRVAAAVPNGMLGGIISAIQACRGDEQRTSFLSLPPFLLFLHQIISAHVHAYIQAMEKLQLDLATSSDLIGVETKSTGLFLRGKEPSKNHSSVFALGDRINILKEIDQPSLIPHIAEANSQRYPYEVLFRSLHKLLMDTATSEYLFCDVFFGEESIFYEIFAGPFAVLDEHFNVALSNCYDAIGLMLMICIVHQHQLVMFRQQIRCLDSYLDKVNISLWTRFQLVFDMHVNSLRNANIRSLWEDDVHLHYVIKSSVEFTSSLGHLNVEYGDGYNLLDQNIKTLRMAIDDLLVRLAKKFTKPKLQKAFLIQNYEMIIAILREGRTRGGLRKAHFEEVRTEKYFDELRKSSTVAFIQEILLEHFNDLIKFVESRGSEESSFSAENPSVTDLEPLVHDVSSRWKAAIKLIEKDITASFSNFESGTRIVTLTLTELLRYYTMFRERVNKMEGGTALTSQLVSTFTFLCEIRKYFITF
ncbi:vacuolar protein sorting-associated protein 52 A-like [Dioscorea cayenensis subsp. rotundata]|uniref:Vacuolar protein sorting-associated protein 52 A-like n=1 Tax=Dioscorea cayennensis subsp. rotundata TaxID=55577 RepID=A0AB40AZH2_DIOCR|nr:vacuolar protein sorting-associated protein 52 A-like [Dioscorea cayenensis subsp. rotundata]